MSLCCGNNANKVYILPHIEHFLPESLSKNMKHIDFIIVGQGLAGSLLAYLLLKKGQNVVVLGDYTEGGKKSSSQIAAGVINPITGMRFVKTWRIDAFLPVARSLYLEIETVLGIKLWHERLIFRALRNIEEENNWLLRNSFPDYQPYCGNTPPSVSNYDKSKFKPFYALAEVKNGAQVNLPALVEHFRLYFEKKQILLNEHFDTSQLTFSKENVLYKGIKASKIIFCEGINAIKNPYFNYLPFNPDKGELLLVRIPNLNLNHIFKNKMAIVPLHDTDLSRDNREGGQKDLYWVGATNVWKFDDDLPSIANKELIINELNKTLDIPFEVIDHQAAIRPTVKDRRPFLGLHPQHPLLGIFNGFGTKGASLVPFWAEHFCTFLLNEKSLDKEVDIQRFQ
jgi:glycine oxidase